MKYFNTPTEFDRRSLTVFGLSVKPNKGVGLFGTGLKHAIAVIMREGHEVVIGDSPVTRHPSEFRGEQVEDLAWKGEVLPFNTNLGRTWELWMAYREILANTLDEGGHTTSDPQDEGEWFTISTDAFDGMDCPMIQTEPLDTFEGFEVYEPDGYMYLNGYRICDLNSKFTYNLLGEYELEENRTLRDEGWVKQTLYSLILDTHYAKDCVKDSDYWESYLSIDYITDYVRKYGNDEGVRKCVRDLLRDEDKPAYALSKSELRILEEAMTIARFAGRVEVFDATTWVSSTFKDVLRLNKNKLDSVEECAKAIYVAQIKTSVRDTLLNRLLNLT